ncbi:MAG: peptide transporter [Desulfurococcus sp.]|uniref:peptide transporter n=1 Tax=Desulfurococcus sp. TaxID=51678 RepID=UPI003D0A65A0
MDRRTITGIMLLVTSILASTVLTYTMNTKVPFDNVSWLTEYLSRKPVLSDACTGINPLDNTCSYFITYTWLSARILGVLGPYGALSIQVLTLILLFYMVYRFFKEPAIAGLTTLIYGTAPVTVFWLTPSNAGPHVFTGILIALFLLTLYKAREVRSTPTVLLTGLTGLVLQLFNPMGWLIVEAALIGLSAEYIVAPLKRVDVKTVSSITLSTTPLLLLPWLRNTYSLIPLFTGSLILATSKLLEDRNSSTGTRLVLVATAISASIALSAALIQLLGGGDYTSVFIKPYNPLIDYGVLCATGLLGLIVFARSRVLEEFPSVRITIISATIILLIASLYDPTLALAEVLFSAVLSGLALYMVTDYVWSHGIKGFETILYRVIALIIVLGIVSSSMLLAVAQNKSQPYIYTYDIQGYSNIGTPIRNESAWLNALTALKQAISNTSVDNILVISYWGYTYWIQGFLAESLPAPRVYTLAHILGGDRGKYIVSSIMLSNEVAASKIISNVTSMINAERTYIIISYLASIRVMMGNKTSNAYLGLAVPVQSQNYYEYIYYAAAGDLARLVLYASITNTSYVDYVNIYNARTGYEIPLAWNNKGSNTLLAQLAVDSLHRLGYTVYNELYSYTSLSSNLNYFKPVAVIGVPVMNITGLYSEYQIIHVVAVYEFTQQ